jgi:hypothetical protein
MSIIGLKRAADALLDTQQWALDAREYAAVSQLLMVHGQLLAIVRTLAVSPVPQLMLLLERRKATVEQFLTPAPQVRIWL